MIVIPELAEGGRERDLTMPHGSIPNVNERKEDLTRCMRMSQRSQTASLSQAEVRSLSRLPSEGRFGMTSR